MSSYLPDVYVGDFFERVNRLPVRPCSIVMQEGWIPAATLLEVKNVIEEESVRQIESCDRPRSRLKSTCPQSDSLVPSIWALPTVPPRESFAFCLQVSLTTRPSDVAHSHSNRFWNRLESIGWRIIWQARSAISSKS